MMIIFSWAFFPVVIDEIGYSKSQKYNPRQKPSQPTFNSVPKFNQYYPSEDIMSENQLAFYKHWKTSWNTRQPLNIDGQLSYVFCYAYKIINSRDNSKIIRELSDLRESYRDEEKLPQYLGSWIGDALILEGRFEDSLKFELSADKRLSIKLALDIHISAQDLAQIQKPRVTKYGVQFVDQIIKIADKKLRMIQLSSVEHILSQFVKAKLEFGKYSFFNGVPGPPIIHTISIEPLTGETTSRLSNESKLDISKAAPLYYFKSSNELINFSKKLFRDAENHLRKEQGVPLIGEGWISETALFYLIEEAFPADDVIHHGKPEWLGRQHLDIYFPAHNVGIEYQGRQHQKPIEFFGGQEAYKKTVERDKRKKRLCVKNNCALIYVYPDYDFKVVKSQIEAAMN